MHRTGSRLCRAIALVGLLVGGRVHADLQRDLDRLLAGSTASDATVGWSVIEVDGDPGHPGTVLSGHDGARALIPASNMKLVTSGAALHVLGPDYTFRTEIGLDGQTLVVTGSGDPALADPVLLERMDPPMTVDAMLDVLAKAVADAGVTAIDALVLDDRVFDREAIHETWPRDQLDKQYCAQVAGINFHANVLRVFVAPGGSVGSAAVVTTQPSAKWLNLANRTRTVASGTNTIWPTREIGTNDFTVHGQVVRKAYSPLEVTVHEPAMFFGNLLADRLRRRGITISGPVRLADPDENLSIDRVLARVTTSIDDVLNRCNQDSRNLYAEALCKLVGHVVTGEPGSWTNGPSVVRMLVGERLGPEAAAGAVAADGSGMSRDNRVSPELLCRWLESMAEDDRLADSYLRSLAVPGEGTLRRRFLANDTSELANQLHAKSGYLNGVRTLSGYLLSPRTGKALAFSFMVNDIKSPEQDRAAKQLIDDAVRELDQYMTGEVSASAAGE